MTDNPYASPSAAPSVEVFATERALETASQGKRFLHLIIDNVVIQILSGVAGFATGVVFFALRGSTDGRLTSTDESSLQLIAFFVGLAVAISYYLLMEYLFQRTLAKLITGTVVIAADGGRPTFGQTVGRTLARFIPFEPFSYLGSTAVGWHDSLSGTRVVNTR